MRIQTLSIAAAAATLSLFGVQSHAQNVLSPADAIIGIDNNRNLPGNSNTGAEGPASAFDENAVPNSKWFTAAREFAGAIITPAGGPATVKSLQFTSANDSSNRDPVTFQHEMRDALRSEVFTHCDSGLAGPDDEDLDLLIGQLNLHELAVFLATPSFNGRLHLYSA